MKRLACVVTFSNEEFKKEMKVHIMTKSADIGEILEHVYESVTNSNNWVHDETTEVTFHFRHISVKKFTGLKEAA